MLGKTVGMGMKLAALPLAIALALASADCNRSQQEPAKPGEGAAVQSAGQPGGAPTEAAKPAAASGEKIDLELYVMSQCPFGVRAIDALLPVKQQLGDALNLKLEYIVSENPDGSFKSLHGENEVQGNLSQLCAAKVAPDKYLNFIACQNKDYRSIPNNVDQCAQTAGIDGAAVKACMQGADGKALLKASMERSKQRQATGSPTIIVAGERYNGGRSTTSFLRAVCGKMQNPAEPCKALPEVPVIKLTVLDDQRCKDCNTSRMADRMKSMFEKIEITTVDYGTEQGKKLYADLKLKFLPAFLFDKGIEKAETYEQLQRHLEPVGDFLSLRVGARFDPTAEICDNGSDDTGDGAVDCADETCKQTLVCREEKPNRLDVYVMSQCPYGVKALDAMKEVLQNFQGKVEFGIHYIADEMPDGSFKALHGQPEVDENIRELCAIKAFPKDFKYMDYIWCRNQNIRDANWQACTGGTTGIDTAAIEKCATGDEGKQLHRASIAESKALGFSASPTWLANNKYRFSGITPEQIKQNLCRYNKDLPNCDKTLSADTKAPPAGACGGN